MSLESPAELPSASTMAHLIAPTGASLVAVGSNASPADDVTAEWRASLERGSYLDVLADDAVGQWQAGVVCAVRDHGIRVLFLVDDPTRSADVPLEAEWIARDCERIRPQGARVVWTPTLDTLAEQQAHLALEAEDEGEEEDAEDEEDDEEEEEESEPKAAAAAPLSDDATWRASLAVGQELDAADRGGSWYTSTIVGVVDASLVIKFHGWASRFNEIIPRSSEKLDRTGARCQHRPETVPSEPTIEPMIEFTPAPAPGSAAVSSSTGLLPQRAQAEDAFDWRVELQEGSTCDSLDTANKWYTITCRDARDDAVLVHYHGWGDRWNEWLPRQSERLAALGTRCATTPDTGSTPAVPVASAVAIQSSQEGATEKWRKWAAEFADSNMGIVPQQPKVVPNPDLGAGAGDVNANTLLPGLPPSATAAVGYTHLGASDGAAEEDSSTARASPSAAVGTNACGCAIRAPPPVAISASSPPVTTVPAASLPVGAFLAQQRQMLTSRVLYVKLEHLLARATSTTGERMQMAHRLITGKDGDALQASQPESGAQQTDGIPPLLDTAPFAAPAAATPAVPAPSSVPSSSTLPASVAILPHLGFYDSSRETMLMRLIQLYHRILKTEARVAWRSYLPALGEVLRTYDVNHVDKGGRSTLFWCVSGLTPRPGGFLFELVRMLLEEGADANAVNARGESIMQTAVSGVGNSFELVLPLLQLLWKHGALGSATATDSMGNSLIHNLLLSGRYAAAAGLLEESLLKAATGADLFATNLAGQTMPALVALMVSRTPADESLQLAAALVSQHAYAWRFDLAPWIRTCVDEHVPVAPLAALVMNYLDGSGRAFTPDGVGTASAIAPTLSLAVGSLIDALDTENSWYLSTILDSKADSVLIHFNQWSDRWDEWIQRDSPRLAPRGTHAHEYGTLPDHVQTDPAQSLQATEI